MTTILFLMAAMTFAALGLADSNNDPASRFIARMDSAPPQQRVPNWDHIKAMMLREPPKVGEPAPDFELKTLDGKETIKLSQFKGSRPVVLIFGSYT